MISFLGTSPLHAQTVNYSIPVGDCLNINPDTVAYYKITACKCCIDTCFYGFYGYKNVTPPFLNNGGVSLCPDSAGVYTNDIFAFWHFLNPSTYSLCHGTTACNNDTVLLPFHVSVIAYYDNKIKINIDHNAEFVYDISTK